jgi:hypothetical protein
MKQRETTVLVGILTMLSFALGHATLSVKDFWHEPGAPNDGFLSNALKRCFRLSGVLLKLCRLISGCAIKFLSVRIF